MALADPNAVSEAPMSALAQIEAVVAKVAQHQTLSRDYLPRLFADDPTLTALQLSGTNCGDVPLTALSDALKVNHSLRRIELDGNEISCDGVIFLAEALEVNISVVSITLRDNQIGTRGAVALSAALEKNNSVQTLDVLGNDAIDASALRTLQMMTTLNSHPPELKAAILALKANRAGELLRLSRAAEVQQAFRDTAHDEHRHIDDWGVTTLAEHLEHNATVTELDLSFQHIGDAGAESLAKMLLTNRKLDRIDLKGNLIAARGAEAFIAALERNTSLRYLSLYENPISETLIVDVEKAVTLNRQPLSLKDAYQRLKANDQRLVHIVLDDHLSQRFYDDISARLLSEALMKNTVLMSLSINNSRITPIGARFLGDVLVLNSALQVVDLSNNPLGAGSQYLTQALLTNTKLLSLRLSATEMPDATAKGVAEALETNTTLTDLDLSLNPDISDAGIAFAQAFNFNTTIKALNLDGTSIPEKVLRVIEERRRLGNESPAFREALKKVIEQAPSLTHLVLTGKGAVQPLRDTSLRILAPALQTNYVVTVLNVSHNEIGYYGFAALCDALLNNIVALEELDISYNPIEKGYELGKLLASLFQVHRRLVKVNAAGTGLDSDGCEALLHVLDANKLNVVRQFCIDDNPGIDARVAFKVWLYVECNSLLPSFKECVRRFFHQWEEDDARALYERRIADFSNYDRGEAPPSTPQRVFNEAARVVAAILSRTRGYEVLKFASNRLGDDGLAYIAAFLREDHGIKTLDLSNNLLSDSGMPQLCDAVKRSFDIVEVSISGNAGVSDALREQLDILLLYNRQPRPIKELLVKVNTNNPTFTKIDFSDRLTDHLQDSHVRLVCDALKSNSHVTSLDLSNNHIRLEGFRNLVDTLECHKGMQRFVLRNTLIRGSEVGELIARLLRASTPFTFLDFSYNDFSEDIVPPIMAAIAENRNVKYLGLQECGISDKVLSSLNNSVSLNSKHFLKDLVPLLKADDPSVTSIDGRGAGYQDPHAVEVIAALATNTHVTSVDLAANGLTDVAGVDVFCHLWGNRCVATLNLASNKLTGTTVASLRTMLKRNETLTSVDLRNNLITEESLEELKSVVLEESWTLSEVLLWSGPWTAKCPFTQETLEHFQETLHLNRQHSVKRTLPALRADDPTLTELDASADKKHCDVGCRHIGAALMTNTHLVSLRLGGGLIGDAGVGYLCRGLTPNRTLTYLDLSRNAIGDGGAASLADMLKVNLTLQTLDLHGNAGVTIEGASILHSVLIINDSLRILDLSGCPDVPAELLRTIAFAITLNNKNGNMKAMLRDQENVVFSELNFSNSRAQGRVFDNEACEILAKSLKSNLFVTKLNLSHNDLSFESGYVLHDLLVANSRLTDINLAHNAINDGSMQIVDALVKNDSVVSLNLNNNGCSALSLEILALYLQLNREPLAMKREVLQIRERDITHSRVVINTPEILSHENRKLQLDDESMQLLTTILRTDLIVRELDLSWNAIGDAGLESIADLLRANNGIHTLLMAHNFIDDKGVLALCELRGACKNLTKVDLRFNHISSAVFTEVCRVLVENAGIVRFSLEGNKLPPTELAVINFLAGCNAHTSGEMRQGLIDAFYNKASSSQELNLSSAAAMGLWSDQSAPLVAFALRACTTVTSLVLEFNDLTDKQLAPLCGMLRVNTTLRSLSLAENQIVDPSELFEALRANSTLKSLDLRKNKLDGAAAKAIATYLRECDGLEELDVSRNAWGRFGVSILISALAMNDSLRRIEVAGDGVPNDLCEAAEHATTLHYKHIKIAPSATPKSAAISPPAHSL